MKALFFVACLVIATIAVYDFFIAPPGERRVFPNEIDLPIKIVHRPPAGTPSPATVSEDMAAPASAPTTTPDKNGFVPPQFAPIETVTKNWTTLPPQAFPRQVKIRKSIEIRMSAGSSTLPDGAEVTALSIAEGNLTVAPTPESTARGTVSIRDTDLIDELNQRYDAWVQARVDLAREAWEFRLTQAKAGDGKPMTVVATADMLDSKGRPVKNASGSYDLLLASIASRQVTEIDPERILRWGNPMSQDLDGVPHWAIDVFYMFDTIFGPFEAQARAFVRDGRVTDWRYAVSGERVR